MALGSDFITPGLYVLICTVGVLKAGPGSSQHSSSLVMGQEWEKAFLLGSLTILPWGSYLCVQVEMPRLERGTDPSSDVPRAMGQLCGTPWSLSTYFSSFGKWSEPSSLLRACLPAWRRAGIKRTPLLPFLWMQFSYLVEIKQLD